MVKRKEIILRDGPCSTCHGFLTPFAFPDTNSLALDGIFAAKGAGVGGMLGDFHLFDLFTEGRSVAGAVFTRDSDFLGTLSLCQTVEYKKEQ